MKKKILIISLLVIILTSLIALLLWKGVDSNSSSSSSNSKVTNTETKEKEEEKTKEVDWGNYDSNDITLDKSLKITSGGVYNLTGEISDGYILIDTEDDVKLVLNNVKITNSNGPAIVVLNASTVEIELKDGSKNYLTDGKTYSTDNSEYDAVIYSKDDLILSGGGYLEINSESFKGIVSKDTLTINDGNYTINATDDGINVNDIITINGGVFKITSSDDAIHADGKLEINNGTFELNAHEGLEATYVVINDGKININASDDGINAANKSEDYSPKIEINGGDITIKMGSGDTDGVDSNGDIIINGGYISVTGQSTFDYDGKASLNGGTVIVNGEKVTTIPNQMMGGGGQGPNRDMQPGGQRRY